MQNKIDSIMPQLVNEKKLFLQSLFLQSGQRVSKCCNKSQHPLFESRYFQEDLPGSAILGLPMVTFRPDFLVVLTSE